MSIQGISASTTAASSITSQKRGPGGKIGQDFQTLSKALSAGDLSAAKTAFATIQSDFKNKADKSSDGDGDDNGTSATSVAASTGSNSPFAALAKALSSGDLSGAQQALSLLQKSGKGHHGHHKGGSGSADATGSTNATASTDATSVDAFLASLMSSSSADSSSNSASSASDPFGISGQTVDIQA